MSKLKVRFIYIFAFFLPFEYLLEVSYGYDTIFKPYRIAGIFLMMLVFIEILKGNKLSNIRFGNIDKMWLFIFLYGGFATIFWHFFSNQPIIQLTVRELLLIFFAYFIYQSILYSKLTLKEIEKTLVFYCCAYFISLFYSFINIDLLHPVRQQGFYRNPTSLSVTSSAVGIICAYYLIKKKYRKIIKLFLFVLSVLCIIGIFISGTRSGFLAFLFGFLFLIFFRSKKRIILHGIFIGGLFVSIILIVYAKYPTIFLLLLGRLDVEQLEMFTRLPIWNASLHLANNHYFLGIGAAQYPAYHTSLWVYFQYTWHPDILKYNFGIHSNFISLLTEYGIICFVIYVVILVKVVKDLIRIIKKNSTISFYAKLFLALFFVKIIEGIFRNTITDPEFWLIFAFIITLNNIDKEQNIINE